MDRPKPPYTAVEHKETRSTTYSVSFDRDQETFDGEKLKIDETSKMFWKDLGIAWVPGHINKWWEQICKKNGIEPHDQKFKNVDYYLVELARNAFEDAGHGEIKVTFEPTRVIVTISDHGPGFNPNQVIKLGHGIDLAVRFADEFMIETNGTKYVKREGTENFTTSSDTDVQQGVRITFVKNFK